MYLTPMLGDDAIEPSGLDYIGRATYLQWTKDVAALGGLAVRLPAQSGKYKGVLGERYPAATIAARELGEPLLWTTGRVYGYYLAPLKVRTLDAAHLASDAITIATGKAAGTLEDGAKQLLGGSILTAIAIGGVAYFLFIHNRSSSIP